MRDFWQSVLLGGFLCLCLDAVIISPSEAGKGVGEDAAYAREMGFEARFYYVASGNGEGQIEFICRAFPGTLGSDDVSDDVWQVQRFTYDTSSRVSTIAFAGDDDAFNQVCANRVTLDYT